MFSKRLLLRLWAVAFFLCSLSAFAQDSPPRVLRLSLPECLRLASENHAKLKARDYAVTAAKWRQEEAELRFWPMVDLKHRMAPVPKDASNAADSFFSGDVTYFNSVRVGIGIPLYAFGQILNAQRLGRQGVLAAGVEKEKDEKQIHYEIKQLYYGILMARELQGLTSDAIRKINNQLREEEKTQKHSPYEIAKLKVFKVDLEKRAAEAAEKEKLAKEGLKIQVGLEENQNFELAGTALGTLEPIAASLNEYSETAAVERPDSRLVDIGVEAKRLEYKLEKSRLLPRLGLGGFFEVGRTTGTIRNLGRTDDFSNPFNYTRAGVGLELEGRFDFHGSHARVKRLDSEYYKAAAERSLAKRGIDLEVQEAYLDAVRARENVARADEKVKLSRQMMFLSKSNLDIGVGEEQEYTDALQLVLLTRGEYIKSLFDYQQAKAKLDWKGGMKRL